MIIIVTENQAVTILWDIPIQTDKGNRQDIVMKDKKDRICLLIDMSIPCNKKEHLFESSRKALEV